MQHEDLNPLEVQLGIQPAVMRYGEKLDQWVMQCSAFVTLSYLGTIMCHTLHCKGLQHVAAQFWAQSFTTSDSVSVDQIRSYLDRSRQDLWLLCAGRYFTVVNIKTRGLSFIMINFKPKSSVHRNCSVKWNTEQVLRSVRRIPRKSHQNLARRILAHSTEVCTALRRYLDISYLHECSALIHV